MMGRPPIFETPEQLETTIQEYLDSCKEGKDYLTITGLALYCGFESRQSFYDYEKRDDFSYIIKKARLHVENAYEKRLNGNVPTGAIFALKNMGWKDSQEIKHELQRGIMNLDALSDDTAHDSPAQDSQT